MSERFTFFYHGLLSQWSPSPFVVGYQRYLCAEQFMMAMKARLFGDELAESLIMQTSSPRSQQDIGRRVHGFDADAWNARARDIVHLGNIAKFTQNRVHFDALTLTAGTTIVEASPTDRIWGIGLAADDARAQDRSAWLGTNWLGEVLTRVRDEILRGRP